MTKSKEKTQKITGLPKDTDRVSFRMLTSEDDPHFALHTMTHSMREVGKKKRVKGGWAIGQCPRPIDPTSLI